MTLKNLKKYLEYMKNGRKTVPERHKMILKQKELAVLEIEKMKQRISLLENKLQYYSKLINDENYNDEWTSPLIFDNQID